jgi:hypothetical protein
MVIILLKDDDRVRTICALKQSSLKIAYYFED